MKASDFGNTEKRKLEHTSEEHRVLSLSTFYSELECEIIKGTMGLWTNLLTALKKIFPFSTL